MGFLKRILSIGSKKDKKRPRSELVDSELRSIHEEEEHEVTVGRLLRSSSTRYAIVSETDYTSLPPLPHPINDVIQTPAASTASLASTSISQRGTYNVTIHRRKQHTLTEFPNANRDLDDSLTTPRRQPRTPNNHLLGLRSDPSVASLLDMYDEHGRIHADAFSNSPPYPQKQERAQTHRSGSTLRQLLGNPKSRGDDTEGDISWAERYLGEMDSTSSTSSLGALNTPDALFHTNDLPRSHIHDTTLTSCHDHSNISENPTISSMEVELSIGANPFPPSDYRSKDRNPYGYSDPTTPRRASQVFGFLTSKQKPTNFDEERSLPEPSSTFSISSDEGSPSAHPHFSSDVSFESACGSFVTSAIPLDDTLYHSDSSDTRPAHSSSYLLDAISRLVNDPQILHTGGQNAPETEGKQRHDVKVIMAGPTKVIVTAPTPSTYYETPSRIPRGSRTQRGSRNQHRRSSARGTKARRSATFAERSNSTDMFTPILSRRKSHRRMSSKNLFSTKSHAEMELPIVRAVEKSFRSERGGRSILGEFDKENGMALSVKPDIPSTSLRSKSTSNATDSRALFRAAVAPSVFRPPVGMVPSPASSSELSPVGRQLMMNLRKQRMTARELDREKSRHQASCMDIRA